MGWIQRRAASFGHAFRGMRWVALHERNGKYHIGHVALCLLLAPALGVLPFCVAFISLGMECMNSALERAVDIAVEGERRKLARIAKDAASAAVLCCLIASVAADISCVIDTLSRAGFLRA